MQCLICEKKLKTLKNMPQNPDGAGDLVASFGYGSKHDQMPYHSVAATDFTFLEKLLASDRIRTWICDKCFKQKAHLFQGFSIKKNITEKRVV